MPVLEVDNAVGLGLLLMVLVVVVVEEEEEEDAATTASRGSPSLSSESPTAA
jgi:hypothetical protein